jgi:hypothetical protein
MLAVDPADHLFALLGGTAIECDGNYKNENIETTVIMREARVDVDETHEGAAAWCASSMITALNLLISNFRSRSV